MFPCEMVASLRIIMVSPGPICVKGGIVKKDNHMILTEIYE